MRENIFFSRKPLILVTKSVPSKVVIFFMRVEYFGGYPSGFVIYTLGKHQTQFHAFIHSVTIKYKNCHKGPD